jgi:hypothetical protein
MAFKEQVPGNGYDPPFCDVPVDRQQRGGLFSKMDKEIRFREKYKTFIVGTIIGIKSRFQSLPWDIKSIYYNDGSNEFQGVSGRRKSNIIDGFEDLYLYVSPIVRTGSDGSAASRLSAVEQSFRKLSSENTFSQRVLGDKDDVGLNVSLHLKIYVSRYNTADDTYWIKPSKEQEQLNKAA